MYVALHGGRCKSLCVIAIAELNVTLFTQTIWHVTLSKGIYNCHCTCKFYDYCPVGANNVVVSAGAEHEF